MIELLSPAGSPEAVRAAVENGANAVYLGCGDFNARRRAKNFTLEDLAWAVEYCHVRGARVYLTLNTLLSDRELSPALETARAANSLGVDAVLVQDLGLASRLKAAFPDLPLHASTQMTIHSLDGVRACADLGLSRVVLSRELSRDAIGDICQKSPVEIEVFVHGALCMCYSGQCFFSAMLGGRSGNRGLCAQPCRLPYNGEKPLSLKDMSLAGHLRELDQMGVSCIKLEGRMKRPEYVAVVTRVYADALREGREPTPEELDRLTAAFSRSGFTQGYFLDKKGPDMFGFRGDATANEEFYAQARATYQKEQALVPVQLWAEIRKNQPIFARITDKDGHTVQAHGPLPQAALHRAVTVQDVSAQLTKTGGTPYGITQADIQVEEGLSVPKSALNQLRRTLLERLTLCRAAAPARRDCPIPPLPKAENSAAAPGRVFTLYHAGQLTPELWRLPHSRIDLPVQEILADEERTKSALEADAKLCVWLPAIAWDREQPPLEEALQKIHSWGVKDALIPTWDRVPLAKKMGFTLHGDFRLGVYNSATLAALKDLGFSSATASFELRESMIRDLAKALPTEAIVYGRLPLMLLEQYPGGRKTDALTDRRDAVFPVGDAPGGRAELLNSQVLYLGDKPRWGEIGLANLRFLFTTETSQQCVDIVRAYETAAPPPQSFTRGLYYREVE